MRRPCGFDSHRPLHSLATPGNAGRQDWGQHVDPMRKSWESTPSATRSRPTAGARSDCGILASMFTFRTRRRWWWLGAIATALVVSLAALVLRPKLEREVRARIESVALRHDMVA